MKKHGLIIVSALMLVFLMVFLWFGISTILNTTPQSISSQQQDQNSQATHTDQSREDHIEPVSEQTQESEPATEAESSSSDDPRRADLELDATKQTNWQLTQSDQKIVYLTFDDGPSENTPKVLDILDHYGIKATFFVTGFEANYRPWIAEAYKRGNSIGMHSYTHDYSYVYSGIGSYFEDLERVSEVVKEQIGFVPFLVRFPGGTSNTVSKKYTPGIMSELAQELPSKGYQYYDWNVSSGDAVAHPQTANIIESSKNYGSATNLIVLMHDSKPHATTVEALPSVIEYYQSQGFTFAPITRESYVHHHKPNN